MNPTQEEITKRGYIEAPDGTKYALGTTAATDYLTKPVSMLSTENAQNTVDQKLNTLNQLSPSTAPGYTAPPTDPTKAVIPKAYFANEVGQDAVYTQEQLNDPATRDFLSKNGFVMTKTEGPSVQASDLKTVDTQLEGLVKTITSYNVDEDPAFKMQKDSISQQFAELRGKMEEANKSRMAIFSTKGIRGGTSRYAGGVQIGIEGEELKQGAARIAEINRREANAVSAARNAYRSGKYTEFNTQVTSLKSLRENKAKELEDFNKKLSETNKKLNDTIYRSSRDTAIADLVAQGVTDPSDLLNYLNYDNAGKVVGDFTAKEIKDTLSNISPNNDLKNLPTTVKEFYALKGEGALPASITNLPEEEQFFQYLAAKKRATTAPPKSGGSNPKTKVYTQPEVIAAGLPLSLVGHSQQDVINSLGTTTVPAWFKEKYTMEKGEPTAMQTTWDAYRAKVNAGKGKTKAAGGPTEPVSLYSK